MLPPESKRTLTARAPDFKPDSLGYESRGVFDQLPTALLLGFVGLVFRVYLGIRNPTVLRLLPSN